VKLELISVHVAKCAGASFGLALDAAYGPNAVYRDYGDAIADPRSPVHIDPTGFYSRVHESGYPWLGGMRVVHGHFNIKKYDRYPGRCRRVTFLRHPVEHRVSLYHFWQTMPRAGHTLQDYLIDDRLDIVEFARLPFIQYLFERVYFAGVDRTTFDFVGARERLAADLARLSKLLGVPLNAPYVNRGPPADSRSNRPEVRRELASILREDIDFYRAWCG
jgi:hypothetical protein